MKQPWDTLHIAQLVESAADGFARNFYEQPFDGLTRAQKQAILRAIASQCRELVGQC
jgi:hypothetical protein